MLDNAIEARPSRRSSPDRGPYPKPARRRLPTLRPRVVIADGDPLARRVLRDLFQAGDKVTVVADARDGVEALELATFYRPDVLLTALDLDRLTGLELLERLREDAPGVRVLFVSSPCPLEDEVAVLRAGACGFLSKDVPIEEYHDVLLRVVRGEATFTPAAAAHLVQVLRRLPQAGNGVRPVRSTLTSREWEITDLLSAGARPADIVEQLGVSRHTVRTHLKHIMRKLDVRTVEGIVDAADRMCRGDGGAV